MNTELRDVLLSVLQVPHDSLRPELTQRDVPAWDSQTHLELIMALEATLGIEFDLAEATSLRSIADIEAALQRHGIAT